MLIGLATVLVSGGLLIWRFGGDLFAKQRVDLLYHTVVEEPLEITVVERGTLEAAKNADIICLVKATRGSMTATSIRWVIDDGTQVKKGDKVVELDKSGLEDQRLTQKIAVDKAKAALIDADGQVRITESQNATDLSEAETLLTLAQLDYDKYVSPKGEFMRDKNKIEGDIKEAESNLEMWRERAAWTRRMVEKKFKSASEAESDEARLKSAELALARLHNEFTVLTEFMRKRTETDLLSKIKEAERKVARVKIQNEAKLATAKSNAETAKSTLSQETEKLRDLDEQIANCTLVAPKDGMVVYFQDERSRGGFGSAGSTIMQGEPVREGQKLIRIPDLSHMLVNTRVHEAMVSRIRTGMKVEVKVDAMPDRVLKASVRSVATVAIANDWRSADVKMYQTMVSIDEEVPTLKPGMSAEVSIHVAATDTSVPTVPVQAIVGGPEMGTKRKLFVKGPNGEPMEREIEIGLSNDKIAEIRSGVKAGDEVVLNPKVLVGDSMRTRQAGDFTSKEGGAPPADGGAKPGTPGTPGAPATPGPGTPPAGGPGASPGGGPAGGPAAGGPGGGRRAQMDPAAFKERLKDPAFKKQMMESPFFQQAMKDQGVDDIEKLDMTKMQQRGGGGGRPMGGAPGGPGAGGPGGGRPMGGGPAGGAPQ